MLVLPLFILALAPSVRRPRWFSCVRFWASIRGALAVLHAFHGTSVEVEKADTRVFINLH